MKTKKDKRICKRKPDRSNKYRHEIDIMLNEVTNVQNKESRCRWCLFILLALGLITTPAIPELGMAIWFFGVVFCIRRHVLMRRIDKAYQQIHELFEDWDQEESLWG